MVIPHQQELPSCQRWSIPRFAFEGRETTQFPRTFRPRFHEHYGILQVEMRDRTGGPRARLSRADLFYNRMARNLTMRKIVCNR